MSVPAPPVINMGPENTVVLTANPIQDNAQPGSVVGIPVWSTSTPGLITLQPAVDGMTCKVIPVGPAGNGTVTWTATGQNGPLSATSTINIIPLATQAYLTAGPVQ